VSRPKRRCRGFAKRFDAVAMQLEKKNRWPTRLSENHDTSQEKGKRNQMADPEI
jgi:hypothetical protein